MAPFAVQGTNAYPVRVDRLGYPGHPTLAAGVAVDIGANVTNQRCTPASLCTTVILESIYMLTVSADGGVATYGFNMTVDTSEISSDNRRIVHMNLMASG